MVAHVAAETMGVFAGASTGLIIAWELLGDLAKPASTHLCAHGYFLGAKHQPYPRLTA